MKSHAQRLMDEELATKKLKMKNLRIGRLLVAGSLLCFALFSLFTVMSTIEPKDSAEAKQPDTGKAEESVPAELTGEDSWELILVNRDNVLPRDFTVDLIKFGDTRVDCRIVEPLRKMIDAAESDGINISVCSGYRSVSEQAELYSSKCQYYINAGYSEEAGEILASQYIQPGGASEHHTGLAVDLLTDGLAELNESFADTPAYSWLEENAVKYGFIERYPKDKGDITGILWEPWHYRYVGQANAEAMKASGYCLEEYLQHLDSGQ